MAHVLHTNGSQTFVRHQDNILASLSHRLERARAAHNFHLIELLERERQQIASTMADQSESPSVIARLNELVQRLMRSLIGNAELQVSEFVNGSDRWWYAFDPETGRCVFADSEAELRLWIKENYQGK